MKVVYTIHGFFCQSSFSFVAFRFLAAHGRTRSICVSFWTHSKI